MAYSLATLSPGNATATINPTSRRDSQRAHQSFGMPATQACPEQLHTDSEFEEGSPLLRELRAIFDWMAQERGAEKIPSRKFKQRLPELHRRMPQIAGSFRRMDANGDCWLEWEEFASFCLKDVSLMQQMRRTTTISVYAKEKSGEITYKEQLDPHRMCEVGTIPPLLAWETSHVVEWRIENLLIGPSSTCPVTHGPMVVRPGSSMASPPFRGGGVSGFLRFWPAGYWTEAQQRLKVHCSAPHFSADVKVQGPYPMPPPEAWCCLGIMMPAGTHLVFRFFAGDKKSEKRQVFWHEGSHPGMLWAPESLERPRMKPGDSLTVGVEIFRNLGAENSMLPKPHKQQGAKKRTPQIIETSEADNFKEPVEKLQLKNSMSLPALPNASTWRSLDKLLQAHRRDVHQKEQSDAFSSTFASRRVFSNGFDGPRVLSDREQDDKLFETIRS